MMDYSELVKALRCKRDDCEGCGLAFLDNDEGWMCRYSAKDDDAADDLRRRHRFAQNQHAAHDLPRPDLLL